MVGLWAGLAPANWLHMGLYSPLEHGMENVDRTPHLMCATQRPLIHG